MEKAVHAELIMQSHTKLIVGLNVGILFAFFIVSITYNAVTTCKKYKAIQPVDINVEASRKQSHNMLIFWMLLYPFNFLKYSYQHSIPSFPFFLSLMIS